MRSDVWSRRTSPSQTTLGVHLRGGVLKSRQADTHPIGIRFSDEGRAARFYKKEMDSFELLAFISVPISNILGQNRGVGVLMIFIFSTNIHHMTKIGIFGTLFRRRNGSCGNH